MHHYLSKPQFSHVHDKGYKEVLPPKRNILTISLHSTKTINNNNKVHILIVKNIAYAKCVIKQHWKYTSLFRKVNSNYTIIVLHNIYLREFKIKYNVPYLLQVSILLCENEQRKYQEKFYASTYFIIFHHSSTLLPHSFPNLEIQHHYNHLRKNTHQFTSYRWVF